MNNLYPLMQALGLKMLLCLIDSKRTDSSNYNAHLIPKNRQGDYKVKRLDPETGDGRPARFLDAEESLEKDLLEEAKKQEKNRRNRKPKHDF